MIHEKSAGQLVDSAGTPASQWAWRLGDACQSVIRWDLPSNWNNPADGLEHFVRDGDWLYFDAFGDPCLLGRRGAESGTSGEIRKWR